MAGDESNIFTRHWRWWLLAFWLITCAALIAMRWNAIHWFALGDTDDNMRMMQVRNLLAGQGWYDLRQYRLDPPYGANIHWSRIVDLPIAAIMLALRPLLGGASAETVAVALAPMLPMAVAMSAIAVVVRRLLSPKAFALGIGMLLCAHSARGMWLPLRIDHHGWQLAMLSLVLVGLTDRKPARGGVVLGVATALSLSIGLEMLIYLAFAGCAVALMWIRDRAHAPRLAAYGASLAGGCALGFLLFASEANRLFLCDALSPVWLSAMVIAGAVAVILAWASPARTGVRFGIALLGGALIAGAFALTWPHCLGKLEGVSPELQELWLSRVREARPVYTHGWKSVVTIATLPLIGLAGYALMLWRNRRDEAALTPWAAIAAPALVAAALLLWQTRAGPAAQLLAVPGATVLAWLLVPRILQHRNMLVRVFGSVLAFGLVSGLALQYAAQYGSKLAPGNAAEAKGSPRAKRMAAVNQANAKCPTLAALRPVARQPKGYVLTFVDLGPRLITVTHHDAVAGPYHRNQTAILDVMRAFRGSAEAAHATVERRGIDYVLICPGMSESTVYRAEAPKGFYVQLSKGRAPAWLEPLALPAGSPFKMWRVVRR